MRNLFLVDGASGTGKSDLLKYASEYSADDVQYVRKLTTRKRRNYEKEDAFLLDLEMVTEEDFERAKPEYAYRYGNHRYGFHAVDLDRALMQADNVFVIVRNLRLIERLASDYSYLNVVPLFVHTDRTELVERLRRDGLSESDIEFRLDRHKRASGDYYTNPSVYREVLINNSSKEQFEGLVQRMLDKHRNAPRISPFTISVMMSFDPDNKELDEYYKAMEEAIASLSEGRFTCLRVDKIKGSNKITEEATQLILESRCVVVDLTGNKQNVYYELGFAHGKGKTCIITASEDTKPTHYPKERKIIFYRSGLDLRDKLASELQGVLRLNARQRAAGDAPL